jgi:hypothetical protein
MKSADFIGSFVITIPATPTHPETIERFVVTTYGRIALAVSIDHVPNSFTRPQLLDYCRQDSQARFHSVTKH